eukprot:14314199-Alexandrium_andersonii.AAC.1
MEEATPPEAPPPPPPDLSPPDPGLRVEVVRSAALRVWSDRPRQHTRSASPGARRGWGARRREGGTQPERSATLGRPMGH